jgi:subtilisin family serine protease
LIPTSSRRAPANLPVVVIFDDGVDFNHPDLDGAAWVNPGEIAGDGIDNDSSGIADDIHGANVNLMNGDPASGTASDHGTSVAGIVAAEDDGVGMTGVGAGSARLMAIGGHYDGPDDKGLRNFERAVDYVVRMKREHGVNIRVMNTSFGDEFYTTDEVARMHAAIMKLAEADVLLVAAAGNDSVDIDNMPRLPAVDDSPNMLTVAALDFAQEALGLFSAWGPKTVELCAPGSSLMSTTAGGGYHWYSGTSFAAPEVAGAAARMFAVNPALTAVEARQILMDTATRDPDLAGLVSTGGKLNVEAAVDRARQLRR